MWHDCGFKVHIFSLYQENRDGNISATYRECFQHHGVHFPLWVQYLSRVAKGIGFLARVIGIRTIGEHWNNLVKMAYFACHCICTSEKVDRCIMIATDPPSLCAASHISKKTSCPYIYFVREMFLSADNNDAIGRVIKHCERKANKNAQNTVEFDETRAQLIQKDNRISPEKMLIIPNAPAGEAKNDRGVYLKRKFGISDENKIALYTGGIAKYNLTYEHIESMSTWPGNVVLVMHCWGYEEDIAKLKEYAKRFDREIYFSTERISFDEIDKLYSAADIGFAVYGSQDLNHKYAGLSSGKMFNFLKACVPVITNATDSCRKAVEKTGCGVCINHIGEAGAAIGKILDNEEYYRLNCLNSFSNFSFTRNYKKFMDAIVDYCSEDENENLYKS